MKLVQFSAIAITIFLFACCPTDAYASRLLPTQASSSNPPAAPADTVTAADSLLLPGYELDEVVVETRKKLVQTDGATLTYNVEEDPDAASNNTLEILRKVPGITVDAEENIKVNGQSSFKIYLNGREDPMMRGDIKTILKSMPATTIKKIEVLSDPGAKYEAEGTGGILNIVTNTRQKLEGYLATLSYFNTTSSLGAGAYARTKIGNVVASLNANYNNSGHLLRQGGTSMQRNENLESFDNRTKLSDSDFHYYAQYVGASFNLSWEPDTLNLFTVSANVNHNDFDNFSNSNVRMLNADGATTWSYRRHGKSTSQWSWVSADASYQHTFHKPGHHIILSYSYGYQGSPSDSPVETTDIVGTPDESVTKFPFQESTSRSHSDDHIFQLDYKYPISEKHLFEAGGKYTASPENNDSWESYGTAASALSRDESTRIKVKQIRDIGALYASYTGTYGRWNTRVGLRYEYTKMGLRYSIGSDPDFTTHLNDLVPNASVSYSMPNASNIRAAYQMRISRPGLYALNPYRNTQNPGYVSYGNPDLKSEKSHRLSLSYANYAHPLSGSVKAGYFFSNNSITDIIFSQDNLIHSTYANVGRTQQASLELQLSWSPTRNLNFNLWASEEYTHVKAESEFLKQSNHGWRTNFNSGIDYTMPFKIRASAYGGGGTGWIDLQSKGAGFYYYGIGLSRSFLKEDRLTLRVSANNFLPAYRKTHWNQESATARTYSENRQRQYSYALSISYRFGALKADVKRTEAEVERESSASTGQSKGN